LLNEVLENIIWLIGAFADVVTIRIRYNENTIYKYFRKKGAQIGENCEIHIKAIPEPYLVSIGNHVLIAQGVILHTHEGGGWILTEEDPNLWVFGKIVIEDNCLIGANAQVISGVRIGRNSIVGAGSVVINDIPPNSIVMGVPARVIGSTINYRKKLLTNWNEQMPPEWPRKNRKKGIQQIKKHLLNKT